MLLTPSLVVGRVGRPSRGRARPFGHHTSRLPSSKVRYDPLLSPQLTHPSSPPSPRQVPSGDLTLNPLFEQVSKSQSLHLGLHLSRHWKAKDCKASRQSAPATPGYLWREEESVSPTLTLRTHPTDGPLTVLKLLSNRHYSPPPEGYDVSSSLEDTHVSDGASSSPSTSERIISERDHAPARTARALVHIDVLAANAPWSPSDDAGIVMGNPLMTPPRSPEAHTFSQTSQVNIFHSPKPRPLRAIDPVVTFTSPSLVDTKSSCSVYFDGNCVHTDVADVSCTSAKDESGMFLYRTALIPQYWDRLCQSHGMFLYLRQAHS
jgi:hypothetical protein